MIIDYYEPTKLNMSDRFKQALRLSHKEIRKHLSPQYQQKVSKKICEHIQTLDQYRYAKKLALYQAIHGEIDLDKLWEQYKE